MLYLSFSPDGLFLLGAVIGGKGFMRMGLGLFIMSGFFLGMMNLRV